MLPLATAAVLCATACASMPAPGGREAATATRAGGGTERDHREIDVAIPGPGITLEGVLAVPEGSGRWPAVVLIHGSGPLSRDERLPGQLGVQFGFDVPVFEQLGRRLAAAGFVVIRYDKRTCTRAHGCNNDYADVVDLHFDDLVADAQAVLDWLRARPEVDPARLYIIGHSQGGSLAPELMIDNPDVRAAVLLAAPFRPIDQVSVYQTDHVERRLLEHDQHPAIIGIRLRQLKEISVGLRQLRAGTLTRTSIADAPIAYWQEWMSLGDAVPALVEQLDRPLLALSGQLDTNVPPEETELWRAAFRSSARKPGHVAAVLPCITHALNCVSKIDGGRLQPERDVSPVVIAKIVEFLRAAH